VLHIQYTSRRDTSGALAAAAGQNVLTMLSEAAQTSLSRGLAMVVDPRAEHSTAWARFRETGSLTISSSALRSNLPFYAKGSAVHVRRIRVLGEYKSTADMQMTLSVGDATVAFTLVQEAEMDGGNGAVSGLGVRDKAYKVGQDEKLVDDMGVRWEAEGEGDGSEDWVLTVQHVEKAKTLRSLQLLVGYTLDM
jgi:hypothetical protein